MRNGVKHKNKLRSPSHNVELKSGNCHTLIIFRDLMVDLGCRWVFDSQFHELCDDIFIDHKDRSEAKNDTITVKSTRVDKY